MLRRGKGAEEFYVQQAYLSALTQEGIQRCCVLSPAIPLTHGKTMTALLACTMLHDVAGLVCDSQEHVVLKHTVFDRAVSTGFVDALHGHYAEAEAAVVAEDSPKAAMGQQLFHWHTHVYCACHDAANALKWSLQPWHTTKDLFDNLFAAASAFRHASCCAAGPLEAWLSSVLLPMPAQALPSPADLRHAWTSLGVQHDVVDLLVDKFKLHWNGRRLTIDETYMHQTPNHNELSTVLLGLWSFRSFTLSRWGTVGLSARSLMIGLLTGFPAMVQQMRHDAHVSGYWVAGADRLGQEEKFYVAVASLSGRVAESVSDALLSDGRLLLQIDDLEHTLDEEVGYLEELPLQAWHLLAQAVSIHAGDSA